MRLSIFFFVLLGLLTSVFSINTHAKKYAHQLQQLSTDDGLSQGYVSDILQDSLGYIWIGTAQGLNRFDGYDISVFPGFEQYSIRLVHQTIDNKVLVSTDFSGAYIIDPETLDVEKIYEGVLSEADKMFSPITAVAQQDEFFYFAIYKHVYVYDHINKTFTLVFTHEKPDHLIRALTIHNNTLYIGTSNGLYSKSLIDGYTTKRPLLPKESQTSGNKNITFLRADPELGLMVGTVEGLYALEFNERKDLDEHFAKTLISQHTIWDYTITPFGEYVVSESGLFQYHRELNNKEFILRYDQSKFTLTDNTIMNVMVDNTGLMWLSSRSQGVFTWSTLAKRFENIEITDNEKLHSNIVLSVLQDTFNTLWIGSENGLTKLNVATSQSTTYLKNDNQKAFFGESSVYSIAKADLGQPEQYLWLERYNGLTIFDKKAHQLIPIKRNGITKDVINKVDTYGYQQIKTDIFAFISVDNFYLYDGNTGQTRVIKGLKEQLDPLNMHTFLKPLTNYPDEFLISASGALYRYNETTQTLTSLYQVKNHNPLMYVTIDDWVIDYNNTLWLASSKEGLIGLDADTYEEKYRINLANGANTNAIYALQIDQYGFLWASSQNGLYKLDLNSMQFNAFTVKDGLTVNEFNRNSHTLLSDGRLAFGTSQGLLTLSPEDFLDIPGSEKQLPVQITNVTLYSKSIDYHPHQYQNKELKLKANDLGLEVSFSNFDYIDINKVRYDISLTGPSSFNYENYKDNKVFIPTLPAGSYELSISVHSKNTKKPNTPAKLHFVVAYKLGFSPFAFAAYTLLALLLLLFIFWQYKTKQRTIKQSHTKVLQSQQQTELALCSSNSGVWEIDLTTYDGTRHRLLNDLGYLDTQDDIPFSEFSQLVHPDDFLKTLQAWKVFLKENNDQQWQAAYRVKHADGHWRWYQDIGKITLRNEQGQPTKVSGIYTNITQQRANAQQAAILGEAFSQINDWLLILDSNYHPLSVNNSFSEALLIDNKNNNLSIKHFLAALGRQQYHHFINVIKTLKAKENYRSDAYIKSKTSNAHPINVSITAIAKEQLAISYYVVVITDLTEQKRAEDDLRYLANYDTLTKLPNRSLMHQKISDVINNTQDKKGLFALLFIDLDKFKPVNDSFGHAVGDQLLCNIAQRVNSMLDSNSLLGRQSGDEFLLLVNNVTSPESLSAFVRSISVELGKRVEIDDFAINISASIGVALYPFDANNADTLIRHADIAMMHAKQAGRNGFKFFTEQMNDIITHKLLLENALKDAYKDKLLFNNYQPIVNTKNNKINGIELLMRWQHDGKLISPGVFIPIAEEAGLIEGMTEQALDRALTELSTLFSVNPRLYLSLNLSPTHILKSNLSERLLAILARHHMKPTQLRLEITENTLLEDKDKAAKQLQMLKSAGFKLLLDDFGTGFSSLTYLSKFPIDVIKIDQSFVRNIGIDQSNEAIIKTIFLLAENLNLYCIAEGVETTQQIEFLSSVGCHNFQGYYFAKPMTADKLLNQGELDQIIDKLNNL